MVCGMSLQQMSAGGVSFLIWLTYLEDGFPPTRSVPETRDEPLPHKADVECIWKCFSFHAYFAYFPAFNGYY